MSALQAPSEGLNSRGRPGLATRAYLIVAVVLVLVAAIAAAFVGSQGPGQSTSHSSTQTSTVLTPADPVAIPPRGYYMGFLPVPASGQTFEQVFKQSSGYAEVIPTWGKPSPFYSFANDLSGSWGESFVQAYTRGNGMIPIIMMSFMGANMTLAAPPGMENATLSDPAWRSAYATAALNVVKAARPLFLSLGNEVNRWYEKYGDSAGDPNGFQNFVSLYNQIYDEVKVLSPQTNVFCTFAREIVSENREADLRVLGLFDPARMDLLVFTSYPFAVAGVHATSDLPSDYYSAAASYMPGKPFGFSELGWSADPFFGGEAGQAQFLSLVTGNLTTGQGVNLRLVCWDWLRDLAPTDQTGLISYNGTERAAFQVWQGLAQQA